MAVRDAMGVNLEGRRVRLERIRLAQARGAAALSEGGLDQTKVTAEVMRGVIKTDADCQEPSGLYEVRKEWLLPEVKEQIAAELGLKISQYVAFQNAVLERAQEVS